MAKQTTKDIAKLKEPEDLQKLSQDISVLIDKTKLNVAYEVNNALVDLYWNIGKSIKLAILKSKRAEYGQEIVYALSRQLTQTYGQGYSRPNLFNMIKFYEVFNDEKIVYSVRRQLSWTHFRRLMYIEDQTKREFYTELARIERWGTRTLDKKIDSMLYERTAIAKKPAELAKKELDALKGDKLTADLILHDPYVVDFLEIPKNYSENDLEGAILNEVERFIEELGTGFCFIARQKRMSIGSKDYYLDLLFFNRRLKRLIAVELKLGTFHPHHKGQMELYLKWLDKYERLEHEEKPLGIILCANKNEEEVELLELNKNGIHVAQYLTELPPKELLEKKLKQAIAIAQEKHNKTYAIESKGD